MTGSARGRRRTSNRKSGRSFIMSPSKKSAAFRPQPLRSISAKHEAPEHVWRIKVEKALRYR